MFIICDGEIPIGEVGLVQINAHDKNANVFIVIGEHDYLNKGIGTQSILFIKDYAFKKLKLHKICIGINAENKRAIRCYEKAGFIEEGILKAYLYNEKANVFHDKLLMAITLPTV
jgi:RimJ/RimL family protein N-acetyltransferase